MLKAAVQMKGFPLAEILINLKGSAAVPLTNVNPENLKKPEAADSSLLGNVSPESLIKPNAARCSLLSIVMVQDLVKLSHYLTKPHFGSLSKPGIGTAQNLTKPDILSAENWAEWLLKTDSENLPKLNIGSVETLTNADIASAEMMTNDDIFTQCRDLNGSHGQEFSESTKKGLQYPLLSIYGYRASAKSGARIGVLEMYKATHDAPSVFFCVLAFDHLFFSVAVIIRAARKVMVGWMGAEKSAPVTLYAGYANPVQPTTSEIGVSGGGITSQYKEAAFMATTLTQSTPKFEYRFLALSRADTAAKPCRISIKATSELEARRTLAPLFILSLAACLPVQEAAK